MYIFDAYTHVGLQHCRTYPCIHHVYKHLYMHIYLLHFRIYIRILIYILILLIHLSIYYSINLSIYYSLHLSKYYSIQFSISICPYIPVAFQCLSFSSRFAEIPCHPSLCSTAQPSPAILAHIFLCHFLCICIKI
jgi:hypothetical protein